MASMSPGSAPRTPTGPTIECGPRPGVFAAQAGEVVDRDAGLEAIEEVRPGVGVDDHVARIDLEDVGQGAVEDAQADGLGG